MIVAMILEQKGHNVVTIGAKATIGEVVSQLAEHKIGAIVVVEDVDDIVGIISERDVVRAVAKSGTEVLSEPVGSIMTSEVMTCEDSETINEVMARMTRGRFRHLPVEKNGRLTGIVSIGDVVRVRIEEVEREAEEMRAYISTA
jgi:CBS domain-containing protein